MFQNTAITEVHLPYTVREVRAFAFDGCKDLNAIYVYRNSTDNINCDTNLKYWPEGKGLTVFCLKGSYGEKFASYLGNNCVYLSGSNLTPAKYMEVYREDGGDASKLDIKEREESKIFAVDLGEKYCTDGITVTTSNKQVADVAFDNDDYNNEKINGRFNFRIRPVFAGTAVVTVTNGKFTHKINVTVNKNLLANQIIIYSPDKRYGDMGTQGVRLLPGNEIQFVAEVLPEGASQEVSFESLNTDVISVDDKGIVKALSTGSTYVRVKALDGSNYYRDVEVSVPYVVDVNSASDIHCLLEDEGWLSFDKECLVGYAHPGIVWRYTPKRPGLEKITFTLKGALGKSGALWVAYGDGTEAANCSTSKEYIYYANASVYRKEINNQVISIWDSKPFAIYYTHGDHGTTSKGFYVSDLKEYGKTYHISYEPTGGSMSDNPYEYEPGDVLLLNPATKSGYEFAGWYLGTEKLPVNEEGKTVFDTAKITGDVTLKAKWKGSIMIPPVKLTLTDKKGTVTTPESSDSPLVVEKGTRVKLSSEMYGTLIYYTTDGSTPDMDSNQYRQEFLVTGDMTIKAYAVMAGQEPSDYAAWIIKLSVPENDLGDVLKEDVDKLFGGDISKIPNGIWVAGIDKETAYTGAAITFPEIRVYDYKTLLSGTTDYKASYKNNKLAYTYLPGDNKFDSKKAPQLIITGKGNYASNTPVYFKIMPRDIDLAAEDSELTHVSDITLNYTGRGQKPAPVVTYNKVAMKAKIDYTYEYKNAEGVTCSEVKEAGDYKLVITGTGNYTGVREATIKVVDTKALNLTLLSKLKVTSVPAQEYKAGGYTKEDIYEIFANPANKISVMDGKTPLTLGLDENDTNGKYYISDVIDSKLPGNATIVLTAAANSEYVGSKEVKFTIKGNALSKAKFYFVNGGERLTKLTTPYTGDTISPEVVLEYQIGKEAPVKLSSETDYDISYSNNKAAGSKATITITGKGAYTGSLKKTFTIAACDITKAHNGSFAVKLSDATNGNHYKYVKGGVKPQPEVIYTYTDNKGETVEQLLSQGVDYTLAYRNNTKVMDEGAVDKRGNSISPMVTVNLKGNYKGAITTKYSIDSRSLSEVRVIVADKPAANKANAWKSTISLVDSNGVKLAASTDYDSKNVHYTYVQDTNIKLLKGGSAVKMAGDAVGANDVLEPGTQIKVEIFAGKSNSYYGTCNAIYKIVASDHDLSKATIKITNPKYNKAAYDYTGSEVRPSKSDIKVFIKVGRDQIEIDPSCYRIEEYKNNVKKGNASLTIRGCNGYGGSKSATYSIVSKTVLAFLF